MCYADMATNKLGMSLLVTKCFCLFFLFMTNAWSREITASILQRRKGSDLLDLKCPFPPTSWAVSGAGANWRPRIFIIMMDCLSISAHVLQAFLTALCWCPEVLKMVSMISPACCCFSGVISLKMHMAMQKIWCQLPTTYQNSFTYGFALLLPLKGLIPWRVQSGQETLAVEF